MVDIFRKKDVTAVDRNFSKSLIQHDPNLADGAATPQQKTTARSGQKRL
jgi:hypothetical protein